MLHRQPDDLSATLDPFGTSSTLLEGNTEYKGVVTMGGKDLAGNHLYQGPSNGNQRKEWTFTVVN